MTKKLYKVTLEHETCFVADEGLSPQQLLRLAEKTMKQALDNEDSIIDFEPIVKPSELPYGWNTDTLPWNGDGVTTVKEYFKEMSDEQNQSRVVG